MKSAISLYKIPLLLSLTVATAFVALTVTKDPIIIGIIVFLCILGTFVLDLDYFIHTYFIEPEKSFSKNLRTFVKHKDLTNVIKHILLHQDEIEDKTLNSALFQITLALFSIFVMYSDVYYPIKAFILSILANSIYRSLEICLTKDTTLWFWSFKRAPDKKGAIIYTIVITLIFGYCLYII